MRIFLDFEARFELLLEVLQDLKDSTALLCMFLGCGTTAYSSSIPLVKRDCGRHT